jgi:hypothetical protein
VFAVIALFALAASSCGDQRNMVSEARPKVSIEKLSYRRIPLNPTPVAAMVYHITATPFSYLDLFKY